MHTNTTALVLFSGGQDSTVCLAHALTQYAHVETLGFDYGQTHRIELDARAHIITQLRRDFSDWDVRLGIDMILPLPALAAIGGTPLIEGGKIEEPTHAPPTSFVPGRNLIFMLTAAAYAYRRGIRVLIGGMCETDHAGYPDCRHASIELIEKNIQIGMEMDCQIETPLMYKTKAQTWEMAALLGGDTLIDIILEHSHTCYYGTRDVRHAWGYGCGDCPSCRLRAEGYAQWQAR